MLLALVNSEHFVKKLRCKNRFIGLKELKEIISDVAKQNEIGRLSLDKEYISESYREKLLRTIHF